MCKHVSVYRFRVIPVFCYFLSPSAGQRCVIWADMGGVITQMRDKCEKIVYEDQAIEIVLRTLCGLVDFIGFTSCVNSIN